MGKTKMILSLMVVIVGVSITLISCTKRSPYEELNDKVIVLFQQGNYAEAEKLAKEALTMAKEKFGQDNPNVAACLDTLAMIYYTQGRYQEAEPLYKEILAIREKTGGPDHPDVEPVLENMVELYKAMGNDAEAKKATERLDKIRSQG